MNKGQEQMRTLLSNDDGILASGMQTRIHASCESVQVPGVAPDHTRSGVLNALPLETHLRTLPDHKKPMALPMLASLTARAVTDRSGQR